MYELIQVGPKSWYIDCPAKIGVYQVNETEVCLIDSGNDKDAGRKVRQVLEVAETILDICQTPTHFERVLQEVFRRYGLTMTFEQYALVGSTVRSFLSWLKDSGKVEVIIADSLLLWHTV